VPGRLDFLRRPDVSIADTKGGDRFVEFRLQGQSNDNLDEAVVFYSFPDSGNDVPRGVGNMVKWIKERDPKVRFGLIENKSRRSDRQFSALADRRTDPRQSGAFRTPSGNLR
jgi:hypothetical protein